MTRDARAKPLVCYGAFEVTHEPGLTTQRALGLIYVNGRDREKQAALVMSKRARVSMSSVELIEFERLDTATRVMVVNAEVASAYKLLTGGDPHHFELPSTQTTEMSR